LDESDWIALPEPHPDRSAVAGLRERDQPAARDVRTRCDERNGKPLANSHLTREQTFSVEHRREPAIP